MVSHRDWCHAIPEKSSLLHLRASLCFHLPFLVVSPMLLTSLTWFLFNSLYIDCWLPVTWPYAHFLIRELFFFFLLSFDVTFEQTSVIPPCHLFNPLFTGLPHVCDSYHGAPDYRSGLRSIVRSPAHRSLDNWALPIIFDALHVMRLILPLSLLQNSPSWYLTICKKKIGSNWKCLHIDGGIQWAGKYICSTE